MRSLFLLMAAVANISPNHAQTLTTTEGSESIETATESSAAVTHTVRVGLQHDFQPDTIKANPGDTIRFDFYPKNHSVVRADFMKPCIPWELTNDPAESFFSGPIEQDTLQTPIPTWDLKVNNTDPVFFYCSAPDSCIKWRMVGVINPNETFTLDIQKEFVANSTFQLSPGEEFPDEASPTPGNESQRTSLSGGAIAGIAIGGAAAVAIVIALVYLCGRKGGIEKGYRRSKITNAGPPQMAHANYTYNGAKSPPMSPPYAMSHTDPYRSSMGSRHTSYMGHPSPGFPPYAAGSPLMSGQEQHPYFEAPDSRRHEGPPVELPGASNHPPY
ncbi:hypothetical protein F4677DRAFT_445954 [Hypoxylon crocopeplum]|nr:hypothetical protein F4677DRAFT_445954 [Hypoxylon crocopeplum]